MAYSNLFKLFAQSSLNLYDDTGWANENERLAGFVSGAIAKSKNVNTAIKSNSLVTMALMDLVAQYGVSESAIALGLASSVSDIKTALLSMLRNITVNKAIADEDGANIAQTYGVDINKSVDSSTDIITLQLLAKTAHGSEEPTRLIGAGIQIETVAKAIAVHGYESNTNANYDILFRPAGSATAVAAKSYYDKAKKFTYNPSTGTMKAPVMQTPTLYPGYGICSTAAGTQAKTCTISGFKLVEGAVILVKFNYDNLVANPTLNVYDGSNYTGAKTIMKNDVVAGTTPQNSWTTGERYFLRYDGSYWQILGSPTKTPQSAIADTANSVKCYYTYIYSSTLDNKFHNLNQAGFFTVKLKFDAEGDWMTCSFYKGKNEDSPIALIGTADNIDVNHTMSGYYGFCYLSYGYQSGGYRTTLRCEAGWFDASTGKITNVKRRTDLYQAVVYRIPVDAEQDQSLD